MKEEKRGGVRKGAGRKFQYAEKTKPVNFNIPISAVAEVKELVKQYLAAKYHSKL